MQREDPVRRQQEKECKSVRHQHLCQQDSSGNKKSQERAQRRQECNTQTRRSACLNPERRLLEQEHNAALGQQVRQNLTSACTIGQVHLLVFYNCHQCSDNILQLSNIDFNK